MDLSRIAEFTRVQIESPFKPRLKTYNGEPEAEYQKRYREELKANINYARELCHFALTNGYAPFASHLLYTQRGILNDRIAEERELGIIAGLAYSWVNKEIWFGTDRGLSSGMLKGLEAWTERNAAIAIDREVVEARYNPDWRPGNGQPRFLLRRGAQTRLTFADQVKGDSGKS